jgi:(2Fe-2S) ferredoxin/vacuolar-type H+-ATPase subunit H
VLVEVSSPEGGPFYYGLATPRQVERVIDEHIIGGKPVREWLISSGEIKTSISRKKGAPLSSGVAASADMGMWRTAINLLGVGWWLGISILAGVLGGLWLDARLNTGPLFTLVGLALGVAFAAFGVYRVVLPIIRDKEGMKMAGLQPGVKSFAGEVEKGTKAPAQATKKPFDHTEEAAKQRQRMADQAKQAESKIEQGMREESKEDLEAIIDKARAEIRQERDEAIGDIRQEFSRLAKEEKGDDQPKGKAK